MRPLSELIKFRNDLIDRLDKSNLTEPIGNIIHQFNLAIAENFDIEAFSAHDKIDQALQDYQKILEQSESIRNDLKSVISDVNNKIEELARNQDTTAKYQKYYVSQELPLPFIINADTHQLIKDRMSHYADWRFPGLRLGCRYFGQLESGDRDYSLTTEYSNLLVANDPLYFYDTNPKLIENETSHFNDTYKRRIRLYQDINQLPKKQFGFIFCWGMFNYLNLLDIESQLKLIFDLLRPGGVLMFSYNNGDIVTSARLCDLEEMSFVPNNSLADILKKIGLEIITNYDCLNNDTLITNISWMEVRQPGDLKTIRLNQVIGTIGQK